MGEGQAGSGGASMRFTRPVFVASFALAAVIFMLYSVSLGHNFLFDEENIILTNPYIKDLSFIPELFKRGFFNLQGLEKPLWTQYFRPLTSLTLSIDYYFWKGNPLGYNLTNVALHILCGLLFFRLLLKIYRNTGVAFLCALLYGVHTIHTEAVTYIASRSDPLTGIFLLSTLLFYWNSRLKWALFTYSISLFAKESMILMPAYLILLEICFLKSGFKRSAAKLVPFFAVTVLFVIYRKFFCPVPLGPSEIDWLGAPLRFLSMGPPFLSYLEALVAPERFKFSQQLHFADRFSDPVVGVTLFILVLLAVLWFILLKYKAGGFFGINLFLVSFLPSIHIVRYYPEWAEHYLYIPLMGLVILLGNFLNELFRSGRRMLLIIFLAVYVLFILFLCVRTWQRNDIYNDAGKFYQALSTSDSPYAYYGYQNLARLAIEQGDWEDAIVPLKTAMLISPYSERTYTLLGLYYAQKRDYAEALRYYEKACALDPENSEFWIHRGNTLVQLGRYDEAAKVFEEVQKKNPKYFPIYVRLITTHELAGRPDRAFFWGREGLEKVSAQTINSAILSMAMARLAYREGDEAEARARLETLIEKYPEVGWYADVARLLTGRMSVEAFTTLLGTRYAGFESAAQGYLLMSHVLNRRCDQISDFLERNKTKIMAASGEGEVELLAVKEIQRAEDALKGCQ